MPAYGLSLTSDNATETILAQTHTPAALANEKFAFVEEVGHALIDAPLRSDAAPAVIGTLDRLAREKQVMLYLNDPSAQTRVERLGLDGGISTDAGDYLMLADTSVLSTKLNLIVEESLDLHLSFDADGA